MPRYRTSLPQLSGDIFLTDAGVETDLIFNHVDRDPRVRRAHIAARSEGAGRTDTIFRGFPRSRSAAGHRIHSRYSDLEGAPPLVG